MFDLKAMQAALRDMEIDGWLLCDFHGSNVLARRVLDFGTDKLTSRRFFYFVPADGPPRKLCHRIEKGVLDHLPGDLRLYLRWEELENGLRALIGRSTRVAMEYSPRNAIPYVSVVDGGTIELVKSFGIDIVSSGNLIQLFEATLDEDQWKSHLEAERYTLTACKKAWGYIADRVRAGKPPRETEVQSLIMDYFGANDLFTDHAPIVAVGPNAGNPHYAPGPLSDATIDQGSLVLIDLWCRIQKPRAVYADYSRMGFVGDSVPKKCADVFGIVREARDAAVQLVRDRFAAGKPVRGFEVDDAARKVIERAGYGEAFIHRTGHNIAQDLHGNGTHMDNLETHDDRLILNRTCFSVEPGIYLDDFGVRSEVNVYVDAAGRVHVTGDPQTEVLALLGAH